MTTIRLFLKPYSVNGTGIRLLDHQRVAENQYEATRWLTLFFIPLLPLGTLLIQHGTGGDRSLGMQCDFRLLGKRPMRWARIGRMYGFTMLAALPIALCAWLETPGENNNVELVLLVFSMLWAIAVLIYAQNERVTFHHGPAVQPLEARDAGPRRAA